jgi:predicted DNA-binding protein with PD1-like motif
MQYRRTQNEMVIRLDRGEKLIENLNQLAMSENLQSAWLQGLGGAQSVELGFYDLETQQYNWRTFAKLMEITSLQGNLAWIDDQPKWHVHGALSGRDFGAIGGHVKELVVGGTCEIRLSFLGDIPLRRRTDTATGLQLLDLSD